MHAASQNSWRWQYSLGRAKCGEPAEAVGNLEPGPLGPWADPQGLLGCKQGILKFPDGHKRLIAPQAVFPCLQVSFTESQEGIGILRKLPDCSLAQPDVLPLDAFGGRQLIAATVVRGFFGDFPDQFTMQNLGDQIRILVQFRQPAAAILQYRSVVRDLYRSPCCPGCQCRQSSLLQMCRNCLFDHGRTAGGKDPARVCQQNNELICD